MIRSEMKYYIVTLGCQMNMSDSERTRAVIESMGYQPAEREEEAGLLGVLACSVRQKAIDKVYSRIHKWNRLKNSRHLLTFVTGCILPDDRKRFLKMFDMVFPMSELHELPDMIKQYGVTGPVSHHGRSQIPPSGPSANKTATALGADLKLNEHLAGFWQTEPLYQSGFEAFVPIQNGCDKFCTFCAVPYTRGREISRPSEEILREVRNLIESEYKSITLLGQNVNSYGLDKKGEELGFAELLKEIGEMGNISGKEFRVYFTSPHPRDMKDDVIRTIAAYTCLAKQIHLPIQSGDDGVLSRMNRKHTVEDYRQIVQSIRKLLPQATLFTDIIVGFTGETDAQFENTRKIFEEFRFNMAYIAQYSPRPGARSSVWQDDIPPQIKKKRFHTLSGDLMRYALENNKQMVGNIYRALVRAKDRKEGWLDGLTEGRINVRIPSDDESLIGTMRDVRITAASEFVVTGEIVRD